MYFIPDGQHTNSPLEGTNGELCKEK